MTVLVRSWMEQTRSRMESIAKDALRRDFPAQLELAVAGSAALRFLADTSGRRPLEAMLMELLHNLATGACVRHLPSFPYDQQPAIALPFFLPSYTRSSHVNDSENETVERRTRTRKRQGFPPSRTQN